MSCYYLTRGILAQTSELSSDKSGEWILSPQVNIDYLNNQTSYADCLGDNNRLANLEGV